jgi:hypothetical protein
MKRLQWPAVFHSNKRSSPEHVRLINPNEDATEDEVLIWRVHKAGATNGEEEYFNNSKNVNKASP